MFPRGPEDRVGRKMLKTEETFGHQAAHSEQVAWPGRELPFTSTVQVGLGPCQGAGSG